MKILIDIGHPAHVHYFKGFIRAMKNKGHEFLVVAREKEVSHQLLNAYGIDFISRGKGSNKFFGKLLYMLKADRKLLGLCLKFKPDYLLSVVSPYAAQVSRIIGKPHIALDDTEHATKARKFYLPFSEYVITPHCFELDLGPKQVRFSGFLELLYLHPRNYVPNPKIKDILGLQEDEKYVILRFVSWGASHDMGHSGIDIKTKYEIIKRLKNKYRIFISAEGDIPDDFQKYRIDIPPEMMHDALSFAHLFVGEGGTMASECAVLATPAIYVNSLDMGYLKEEEKNGLIYGFRSPEGVLAKLDQLLNDNNLHEAVRKKRDNMIEEFIDPTKLLIDFFEHYSEVPKKLQSNSKFQLKYK